MTFTNLIRLILAFPAGTLGSGILPAVNRWLNPDAGLFLGSMLNDALTISSAMIICSVITPKWKTSLAIITGGAHVALWVINAAISPRFSSPWIEWLHVATVITAGATSWHWIRKTEMNMIRGSA